MRVPIYRNGAGNFLLQDINDGNPGGSSNVCQVWCPPISADLRGRKGGDEDVQQAECKEEVIYTYCLFQCVAIPFVLPAEVNLIAITRDKAAV